MYQDLFKIPYQYPKVQLVKTNKEFFGLTHEKIYQVLDACITAGNEEITLKDDAGYKNRYYLHGFNILH